jgi:transcriptional regulator with XRE-family HTH domain
MRKHGPTPFSQARAELGVTQQELADFLGISRNYVSLLEIGQRSATPDLLRRLREWKAVHATISRQGADMAAATPGPDVDSAANDPACRYSGEPVARSELETLRAQVASLARTVESQAATIERLSRGVCRYPDASASGPSSSECGAQSRAG